MTPQSVPRLEELSLNSWPAPKRLVLDGWVLQFAAGYTSRANSIHPLYDGGGDVRERIRACERHYTAAGLPTKFKITPASAPSGLEGALAEAGFHAAPGAHVQTAALDASLASLPAANLSWDYADDTWTTTYRAFRGLSDGHYSALRAILAGIALPMHFAAVTDDAGEIMAVGLAVREDGWVGLFDIMVRPGARGQGHGRRIVQALLGWAARADAQRAYLQVEVANAPAIKLYESVGFREAYTYRYFTKVTPAAASPAVPRST